MMALCRLTPICLAVSFAACSASQPPPAYEPPSPEVQDADAPTEDAEAATVVEPRKSHVAPVFPEQCADDNAPGICGTPDAFAHEICAGAAKPDVALRLFAKGSPFTRGFVRRNTEAWYTGSRSAKASLKREEEIIVLRHPSPKGGIIINGGDTPFDVMRFDGACATLGPDEVSLKRPDAPNHPAVPWRQLDPRVKEALLSDPGIAKASASYEEACKEREGAACGWAKTRLTGAVLRFIGRGGKALGGWGGLRSP
jgi:hypothetical protein